MILIENNELQVGINLKGAEMWRVYDKSKNEERLWNGDVTYWSRVSPVLFPNVGRVKNGFTFIDGERYELEQHGFLRDQMFEVENQTGTSVVFCFRSDGKFLNVYPYDFEARLSYELKGKTLDVVWDIKNLSDKTMFYSIGGHPAFMMDVNRSYHFELEGNDVKLLTLEDGHIDKLLDADNNVSVDVNYENFKDDAVIYSNINRVELIDDFGNLHVAVDCEGFDFVGLWGNTKHGHMSPFVCIEPWLGITDDVNSDNIFHNKRGIRSILSGEVDHNLYTIHF